MKMLVVAWDDTCTTALQNYFKKASFSDEEKDGNSDNPFPTWNIQSSSLNFAMEIWFLTMSHVMIFWYSMKKFLQRKKF